MPRPIAAPTPLPACAGVGVVRDSAAIAPANAAPLPICPKQLNTVWFVLMAPLHLLQFQVRCVGSMCPILDRADGSPGRRTGCHASPYFRYVLDCGSARDLGSSTASGRSSEMKVLKGARLIDGTGAGPQPGATVVIRGERIEAVTTKPAGEWPQDAEIIDVSGMTILPGLIDCHDHMAMHGYDLARRWGIDEPQSTRTLRTAKVLEQTLGMGYTAVRDAAGLDAGFKRAIEEGLISGPRLVVSLCIISPIGGIGDRVSPSGFSCCVPHDPLLPDGVVNSLADVRPVVRRVVRAGADVIKCATTGGASSRPEHGPRDGAFNLDEMQALTDEAHALDRRVMCHALGGRGLRIAIEAGVDSIEHGCYLDEEPELLDAMAERGILTGSATAPAPLLW